MIKFYLICMASILFMMPCFAQNVAINEDGSLPDPHAMLDIKSGNKGLLIPRMSTAARLSIHAPKGLLVYDTITMAFWYSEGSFINAALDTVTLWKKLATGNNWSLTGDIGIDSITPFLGTLNNAPLNIRVNNQPAGRIDPTLFNTFWGYQSGVGNPGITNPGTGNTASGYRSLHSNLTGSNNTATGMYVLQMNTSGLSNTASGAWALAQNTTGSNNTANGIAALYKNATGSYNTAIGYNTLSENITGSMNTAIGVLATVSSSFLTNATAIGYGATVNASNKIRIGNSAVTSIEGQVPFTVPSDGRFKFQVKEDVKGLDFILQLRPVTYQFDVKRFNTQYSQTVAGNENSNGNYALQAAYDEATSVRRSGFIAQEVEKAANTVGYNFSGILRPQTPEDHYSLSYEAFVVPLVKAVQEQQQAITAQNKIIAELQQQLKEIKQLLQASK